jgi:hypothetical protein
MIVFGDMLAKKLSSKVFIQGLIANMVSKGIHALRKRLISAKSMFT